MSLSLLFPEPEPRRAAPDWPEGERAALRAKSDSDTAGLLKLGIMFLAFFTFGFRTFFYSLIESTPTELPANQAKEFNNAILIQAAEAGILFIAALLICFGLSVFSGGRRSRFYPAFYSPFLWLLNLPPWVLLVNISNADDLNESWFFALGVFSYTIQSISSREIIISISAFFCLLFFYRECSIRGARFTLPRLGVYKKWLPLIAPLILNGIVINSWVREGINPNDPMQHVLATIFPLAIYYLAVIAIHSGWSAIFIQWSFSLPFLYPGDILFPHPIPVLFFALTMLALTTNSRGTIVALALLAGLSSYLNLAILPGLLLFLLLDKRKSPQVGAAALGYLAALMITFLAWPTPTFLMRFVESASSPESNYSIIRAPSLLFAANFGIALAIVSAIAAPRTILITIWIFVLPLLLMLTRSHVPILSYEGPTLVFVSAVGFIFALRAFTIGKSGANRFSFDPIVFNSPMQIIKSRSFPILLIGIWITLVETIIYHPW